MVTVTVPETGTETETETETLCWRRIRCRLWSRRRLASLDAQRATLKAGRWCGCGCGCDSIPGI